MFIFCILKYRELFYTYWIDSEILDFILINKKIRLLGKIEKSKVKAIKLYFRLKKSNYNSFALILYITNIIIKILN